MLSFQIFLVIEIVSAIKKVETVWMKVGVDVALVICPYSEKIYIFEKGATGYKEQSIYQDFSHPLLPGYSENFGKYLQED